MSIRRTVQLSCAVSVLSLTVSTATLAAGAPPACSRSDFEEVVEQAAGGLRDLNARNKPSFQEQLRALKDKRGWTHDQFLKEAAPYVRDAEIETYDRRTEELLNAILGMGQEGASRATPDCAVLLDLRARMTLLVETQTAKWAYMFKKIAADLVR